MSTSKHGNGSKGTTEEKVMVDASPPHVLVVDDSPIDRRITSMVLKRSSIQGIKFSLLISRKPLLFYT